MLRQRQSNFSLLCLWKSSIPNFMFEPFLSMSVLVCECIAFPAQIPALATLFELPSVSRESRTKSPNATC